MFDTNPMNPAEADFGWRVTNNGESLDEQRARLVDLSERASGIINAADAESRPLTKDEGDTVEKLNAEFDSVQAEIGQREKVAAMRAQVSRPVGVQAELPPLPGDIVHAARTAENARAGILLPANCARPSALLVPRASDPKGGAETFFRAIANRVYTPELVKNAYGNEGSGADGGFSVPPSWFAGVIDQALQAAEFAPRARIFPSTGPALTIPMPDYTNRQTDLAGLSGNWSAEGATQTAQRLRWRQVNVPANKLFILAEASGELAEDGLGFAMQLQQGLSTAAAYSLDAAILGGTGVGQPLGILSDPAAISVNPESGQAADSVLFQNLVNVYSRLAPACQKRATWFISPGVLPSLLTLTFPSSGGAVIPVLLGNGNATNAAAGEPVGTIFGRPVVVTEISRAIGDPGDVVFADVTQYALVVRAGARIEMNAGPGFNRDVMSWRLIWRVGGQSFWNAAISPYAGGLSLSWCAYLAARA